MLPGFRFLFSAVVLSMSILVFGLGAAALFRAAHETFASTPSLHAPAETNFAQQGEATRPVLSMLRLDPAVPEKPAVMAPAEPAAPRSTPPEQATTGTTPAEPEQTAALQPADAPASAKPDTPVADHPQQDQAAPAPGETAAPQAATGAPDEIRMAVSTAATEQDSPPASEPAPAAEIAAPVAEAAPAPIEPAPAPSPADTETFSTTIATLGGPPVAIGPAAKAVDAKPDKGATKKHDEAKRTHRHRRIARAQVAVQAPQPVDPFGQPAVGLSRQRIPR